MIREPAVTPAGISYERSALMQWLEHQHTEPSTKRRLKRSRVVPNLTLRAMIEDWLADERAERRQRALGEAAKRLTDSGTGTGGVPLAPPAGDARDASGDAASGSLSLIHI